MGDLNVELKGIKEEDRGRLLRIVEIVKEIMAILKSVEGGDLGTLIVEPFRKWVEGVPGVPFYRDYVAIREYARKKWLFIPYRRKRWLFAILFSGYGFKDGYLDNTLIIRATGDVYSVVHRKVQGTAEFYNLKLDFKVEDPLFFNSR